MKRPLLVITLLGALLAALVGPSVGTASAETAPTVTVTSSHSRYPAGVNAAVTIKVANGGNGTLAVRAETANGKTYQLNCGAAGVNATTQSCSVPMVITTRVVASLSGGMNGDATASKRLYVYPKMVTYARSFRAYSGNYAVYARGDEPLFRTTVYPARYAMCIRHRVQVLRSAGWSTVGTSSCKRPDSEGRVGFRWYGSHPVGPKFRVFAVFAGDSLNSAGSGSRSYFTFR